MKWFKHYSNASTSNALTALMAKHGFEGYGRYWILLELMCEKFDGIEDQKFVFDARSLKGHLGFYHTNHLMMYLQCMSDVGLMSVESTRYTVTISSDILLRLKGRDYKKARSERGDTAPKRETKIETKINKPKDNFGEQFDPMHRQVKDFLESNNLSGPKIRRYMSKIVESFDSWEEFDRWVKNLKEQSRYKSMTKHAEKSNYFTVALLSEIGVINA